MTATFRHPSLVAKSLDVRNNFTHSKSISLWKEYNQRLLCYHEKSPFPVISFDLSEARYQNKIKMLLDLLDLDSTDDAFAFYDGNLRHNDDEITDIDLPGDVLEMYEKLNRAAI